MSTNQDYYRIAPIEMAILLISMIIGVGILTIPRVLASELETADGWMSIGIAGLFIIVAISLYVQLQRNFPGRNLLQYIGEGKKGKWVAKILSFGFIVYFIALVGFEARMLGIVVKMFLLDQTPVVVIVAIILLTTTYAVSKGVQGIVHLCLMFIPIVVLIALLIFPFNIPEFNIDYFLPILPEGIMPVMIGVKEMVLAFLGIEILFFFMAYMNVEDLKARPLNLAISFITFLYILVYLFSVALFGVELSKYITFPTVELAKAIEIPGGFLERMESLMITVWIMTIFKTMSITLLLAVQTWKKQFLVKKNGTFLPAIIVFITFLVAFLPKSITETLQMGDYLGWTGLILFLFGLVMGYLTVWLRKKKAQSNQARGM